MWKYRFQVAQKQVNAGSTYILINECGIIACALLELFFAAAGMASKISAVETSELDHRAISSESVENEEDRYCFA